MENTFTKIANLQKININKGSFAKLPEDPGVYFFFQDRKVLYIGKAKNLRNRLRSYLNIRLGPKTSAMIKESDSISFIKVTSELESLLLEAKLINKYKPQYNIIAKDDKHPLYIVITKEEFPRLLSARKLSSNNFTAQAVFGPFPSSTNVKMILKMIRKIIPYSDHKLGKRPCLYSQIGLCNPCPNTADNKQKKEYRKNIRNIKKFLQGKFDQVEKNLVKDMNNYSKTNNFEKAAEIRDKIKLFKYITQPQIPVYQFLQNPNLAEDLKYKELESLKKIIPNTQSLKRIECYDIAHLAGSSATASMVVFINGQAEKSEYRHFRIRQKKGMSDYDSMREVARRRYKNIKNWGKPNLIIVDGGVGQVRIFENTFKELNIPVVGIAKHPDRLIFPNSSKLRLKGNAWRLVSALRDESHRFARRYHHLLIKKSLLD